MGSDERDEVADPELLERRRREQAPVDEAGGGESEGFELSEEELIERVEGEKGHGHPLGDGFPAEASNPADHTAYGDADQIESDVDEPAGDDEE